MPNVFMSNVKNPPNPPLLKGGEGGISTSLKRRVAGVLILFAVLLAALIALPMWKGAHHMRHMSLDHGGGDRDHVVAPVLYGVALIGSIGALLAVIRL